MISKTRQVTYRVAHRWDEKTRLRRKIKETIELNNVIRERMFAFYSILSVVIRGKSGDIEERYRDVKRTCAEFIKKYKGFNSDERYQLTYRHPSSQRDIISYRDCPQFLTPIGKCR